VATVRFMQNPTVQQFVLLLAILFVLNIGFTVFFGGRYDVVEVMVK
jgi:hypothetical protein